jgi:DNA-binding beta-propeller fold protein YncE
MLIGLILVGLATDVVLAAGPFALVAGRRDPRVIIVDLAKAVEPVNNGTSNAVLTRVRVTRDVDTNGDGVPDAPAAGLPSSVVAAPDGRAAYVVNHAGNATPAAVNDFQHGHLGTVAVLDMAAALNPANRNTTAALKAVIPTGFWGPVGLGLTRTGKAALVTNSESDGKEDGAREISVVDLDKGAVAHTVRLGLGDGGREPQAAGASCAELAADPARLAKALPHVSFGCFPASNALGISRRRGEFAFTANGGTDDVSFIDVDRAVTGDPRVEVARVRVLLGPWGLAVSGALWVIDLSSNTAVATVTGVGNEPYLVDVTLGPRP